MRRDRPVAAWRRSVTTCLRAALAAMCNVGRYLGPVIPATPDDRWVPSPALDEYAPAFEEPPPQRHRVFARLQRLLSRAHVDRAARPWR